MTDVRPDKVMCDILWPSARIKQSGPAPVPISNKVQLDVLFLRNALQRTQECVCQKLFYESFATVGEIRVYRRADFQSGSRVLKKVF